MSNTEKEMTFEQKLARIEEIVLILESGKEELNKSLALYEEGIALTREVSKMLDEVKGKIEEINK